MPVLVEQREVPLRTSGGVVQVATGAGQAWGQIAETMGQVAGQMGRMLGDMAEDEAVALASQVTLDESYNPVLPEGRAREKFGLVARRAFDKTVLPRQLAMLEADLGGIIDSVRDQHSDDPEGFAAAIGPAIDAMAAEVPAELQGFLQTSVAGMVRQTAGRIGWNRAQDDRRIQSDEFGVNVGRMVDDVWLRAQAGEDVSAAIGDLTAQADDLLARRIITPSQHDAAMRELDAAKGAGGLLGEIDAEAYTPEQLREVQDRLIRGNDADLNARFVTDEARMRAASRLGSIAAMAEARAREEQAAAETATALRAVWTGAADATDRNRELLDAGLGQALGVGQLSPDDWTSGSITDAGVWDQIRLAGFAPSSLRGAFRQFSNGALGAPGAETMFRMWKALSQGRAPDGTPVSIAGDVDPDAVERLQLVEALAPIHGFENAYEMSGEMLAKPVDPEALAVRLNRDAGKLVRGASFNPDDVRSQVPAFIRQLTQEQMKIGLPADDLALFSAQFTSLVGRNVPVADAWTMVRNQIEQTIPETSFMYDASMGPVMRSRFAPEKFYAVPKETLMGRLAAAVGLGETWFEGWASEQIRTRAAGVELPEGTLSHGAGGFYVLEADPRSTGRPVYYVKADDDGDGIYDTVFDQRGQRLVLDPEADWRRAMAPSQAADAAAMEEARRRRDAGNAALQTIDPSTIGNPLP